MLGEEDVATLPARVTSHLRAPVTAISEISCRPLNALLTNPVTAGLQIVEGLADCPDGIRPWSR